MKRATRKMKHIFAMGLALLTLLSLFSGCGVSLPRETGELWLVTEQSTWDRMNGQLQALKEAYEAAHKGVSIRVECLPTAKQEREVRLQKLRTEILQGRGPDCYLLPTDNTLILDEPAQYTYARVEPLFPDVELAMRNGLFYDISAWYDADEALDREGLNAMVMDAGVVDGMRLVLPLRYDVPVIYGLDEALEAAGLDPNVLNQDLCTIMEAVLETGDPVLAGGILYGDYGAFSDFIDYDSGNATLQTEAVRRYLEDYQKLKALLGDGYLDLGRDENNHPELTGILEQVHLEKLDVTKYIYCRYEEAEAGIAYYPLWIGSMQDAFDYLPMSEYADSPLRVVPLRTIGTGELVATVRCYAAVGSGCGDPALAYDFLRQFLMEESQWERNRPTRQHWKPVKGAAANTSNDLQFPGLIEGGWPVRDQTPFQTLWNVRRRQVYIRDMIANDTSQFFTSEQIRRNWQIGRMGFPTDYRLLDDAVIGQVRFNTTMSDSFADMLARLNDPDAGYAPLPVDLDRLAEQLIWELRWHVSEG